MLWETENLRVTTDAETATLWLDFPGESPNRLDAGRVAEIGRAVVEVCARPAVEILVVRSAKPAGFCGGYFADSLATLATDADRLAFTRAGKTVLAALAAAPFVSLAFLEGPCLGPGLSLALACDHRLMVATPDAELGFPESAVGVLPAWGGVTRLARLAPRAGLGRLLAGETVTAREAFAAGIVDRVCCGRRAKIDLQTFLDDLHRRPRKARGRWRLPQKWEPTGRDESTEPTPFAVARIVAAAGQGAAAGFAAERREFARTPATGGVELLCHSSNSGVLISLPTTAAVVGRSPLAADLAARGVAVMTADAVDLRDAFFRGRLTPLECDQAASRVRPGDPSAAEWVIVSDPDVPFPEVEADVRRGAIIAVANRDPAADRELADRPDRIIGVVFPPGNAGKIVELVPGPGTAGRVVTTCGGWFRSLGFTPVVVSESVVRRVVAAVWDEAARLAAEGHPIDAIDRAATLAGFARGPLADMDETGIAAASKLVPRLKSMVAADLLGGDRHDGFYHYPADDERRPNLIAQVILWDAMCLEAAGRGRAVGVPDPAACPPEDVRDRLRIRAINAAAAALAADAFAGPADVDFLAAVGAGLLASAGGPLRFADGTGAAAVARTAARLAGAYGKRFAPHPELTRRVAAGETFYARPAGPPRPGSRAAA